MPDTVAVAIPSIPVRPDLLQRAVGSVLRQTYPVRQLSISVDHERLGAAGNRQRALNGVAADTDWVAFLDDDDAFMPEHIEKLVNFARETGADYVFSWFQVVAGGDPFPQHFGKKYDVTAPHHTTITVMVKTELAQSVGFRPAGGGEDWDFTLRCIEAGAKIEHLPERTWYWYHDTQNTSGRPDRW
jgi:glycosyltransferase involved in cell wall biosynthesis